MTLAWGYKAIDSGSLNKVYEKTDAVLDPSTNFTSPEAQAWLLQLCQGLEDWSQKADSPIVINTVQCPLPLVQEIAAARDVAFPMPPEVRPWPSAVCTTHDSLPYHQNSETSATF